MKKEVRVYNLIFPIWMLIIFPLAWWVILPANFIIDSIVVLVGFMIFGIKNKYKQYKACIVKVWLFGFVADFIGAGFLMMVSSGDKFLKVDHRWWYDNIYYPIAYSPFKTTWSVAIIGVVVAIVAILIYLFNVKITLKKLDITLNEKRKIALLMSVITAPYLFFLPLDRFNF